MNLTGLNQGIGRAVFFPGGSRKESVFLPSPTFGGCPIPWSSPLPSSKPAMISPVFLMFHYPDTPFCLPFPLIRTLVITLDPLGSSRIIISSPQGHPIRNLNSIYNLSPSPYNRHIWVPEVMVWTFLPTTRRC